MMKRMNGKTVSAGAVALVCAAAACCADASVLDGFAEPPRAYRPETWFQVSGGNFTKEGTTLDLEAVARAGFMGIHFFHEQVGTPVAWPGVAEQVPCLSPHWEEHVRHLGDECRRLDLRLLMHTCPGWSMAGGPWVPDDRTMRELVFSTARSTGGRVGEVVLSAKATDQPWRDYRDIALVAFPSAAGNVVEPLRPVSVTGTRTTDPITVREYYCQPIVTRPPDDEETSAANWREATVGKGTGRFAFPSENDEASVELDYGKDVTVRTLELSPVQRMNHFWSFQPDVTVVVEALSPACWREILVRPMPQATWQDELPISLALPTTTARRFRVRFRHVHPLVLSFVRFYSGARPDNFEAESARTLRSLMHGVDPASVANDAVPPESVRQVKVGDVLPPGDWTLLRVGHVNSGIRNHPAPPEATGWECDKLSRRGADAHFAGYVGKLTAAGGPLADGRLGGLLMDSWECAAQSWTEGLDSVFAARWKYALTSWWPALCGYVVGDRARTSLFFRDWRELLGDLVSDEFYGRMAKLAHDHGQVITYETCGGDVFPSDPMRHWKDADVPMCEFWRPRTRTGGVGSPDYKAIRPCVSAARIYGKNRVAAEALTKAGPEWAIEHPRFFKADLDHYFALGVTHMVFGNFTHNPQADDFLPPGPTYTPNISVPMMRKHAWWRHARAFTDYLTRTQYLLEQGRNVSDVLLYLGDAVDHKPPHHLPFPAGLNYDYLNRDALMTRLSVKNGLWTTPEGLGWKALWLYDETWMRPETKAKIAAAEAQGAKVIRGDVFAGVKALGLVPQVRVPQNLMWQHRTTGDEDIYFLAEEDGKPFAGEVLLSGTGEAVVADPVSGDVTAADASTEDGMTKVRLDLPQAGARFVILRRSGGATPREREAVSGQAEIRGPWKLSFAKGWGIDSPLVVDKLVSWTKLPVSEEGRAYSGMVVYETSFDCEDPAKACVLDLGRVDFLAEVKLNGRRVGCLWTPPYRIRIDGFVKKGRNELSVEVAGTWINRLRYDARRPEKDRKTWTNAWPQPDEREQETGLFGPVTLGMAAKP